MRSLPDNECIRRLKPSIWEQERISKDRTKIEQRIPLASFHYHNEGIQYACRADMLPPEFGVIGGGRFFGSGSVGVIFEGLSSGINEHHRD